MTDEIEVSAPYRCSQPQYAEMISCVEDGPQWWQIRRQLLWSLFVWGIVIVGSFPAGWFWRTYFYPRPGVPPRWAQIYIGTEFRSAKSLNLENALCVLQFLSSSALVWIWVQQSYAQKTIRTGPYIVQFISVMLCCLHSFFERLRNGFSVRHALTFSIFLDCLTLPPIITQGNGDWAGGSWLTLAYLRTYHCWKPMKRLLETDFFDHVLSDFVQECVLAILECILVVFSIAGTLWLFESMGDIEGFSDQFTDSGMGEISFFQMVYFSFVTISTVGFGDYSPTTVLSRAFIVFATFGGVIFFSYMTVHVFHIFDVESSGRGKFVPLKKTPSGRGHVLIMGGGVTCGSVTVLETFLRALCRSDCQADIAEIVLLGQSRCSDKVRKMLKSEWAQGFKLSYFIGSPLDPADLQRVRAKDASISFIIADFHSPDTKMEDTGNSLFASALQRCVPDAQCGLMLVSMPSLSLCSSIGLQESSFFSIEALKASMMATSIRCPGFSTLILNLGLPDLPPFDTAIPGEPVSQWLIEYVQGCRLEPYGFLPGNYLIGLTFTRAAIRASLLGGVLLLGAQVGNGAVQINPKSSIITVNTVLFALAKDSSSCDVLARNNDAGVHSWIDQFHANRQAGNFWKKQHSKSVRKYNQQELDTVYNIDKKETGFRRTFDGMPIPVLKKKPGLKHHQSKSHMAHGDATLQTLSSVAVDTPANSSTGKGKQSSFSENLAMPTPVLNAFTNKENGETEGGGSGSISQSTSVKRRQQSQKTIDAQDNTVMHQGGPWKKLAKMATATGNLGDLSTLARQGGHTVLILQEDHDELDQQTLWEQLDIIVKGLAHARDERPIVVVHSYLATPSRQRFMAMKGRFGFENVSFCVGDPLNPLILQAAGVDTCARLLTIAPSAPPTEISPDGATLLVRSDQKMDESNLMLVMLLEQHMGVWGRTDLKAIFDWYAPSSLNLLPFPPPPPKLPKVWPTSSESTLSEEELKILRPFAKQLSPARRGSFPKPTDFAPRSNRRVTPVLKSLVESQKKTDDASPSPTKETTPIKTKGLPGHHFTLENPLSEGDQAYAQRDPRGHYRFAAGQIIPKPFIAALYSMAYYTPGVLEIMESLINPHQYDQDSMPWIFKVPERLVNQQYNVVASELLEAETLPLGLLRAGGEEAGTPLPYVVTLTPGSDFILRASDCVYVLAEHEWAVKHGLDGGPTSQMSQGWTKITDLAKSMDSSMDLTSPAAKAFQYFNTASSIDSDDLGSRSQRVSVNSEFGPDSYSETIDLKENGEEHDDDEGKEGEEEDGEYDDDEGEYEEGEYDEEEYDEEEQDAVEANRKPRSRRRPKNIAFRGKWVGRKGNPDIFHKPKLDYPGAQQKTGKVVQNSR